MGVLIPESSQSQTETQTVEGLAENGLKDKKKKRRSRRSKQNSSVSASTSVSEIRGDEESSSGFHTPLNTLAPNDDQHTAKTSCGAEFYLMPPNSVQDSALREELMGPVPFVRPVDYHARRKCFPPHWSAEDVRKALENGNAFKALFRVNAHNKLEAYCKIDGVQTDILVSGAEAQNRAVEGDTVAIVVDPPSLWTKMKGSTETIEDAAPVNDSSCQAEATDNVQDSSMARNRFDPEVEYACPGNFWISPDEGFNYASGTPCGGTIHQQHMSENFNDCGHYPSASDYSGTYCSGDVNVEGTAVQKLCTIVNSLPSKRPTGRIVAIIERSPRRDNIVGFLSVKQSIYGRDDYKKDSRRHKHRLSTFDHAYILLAPTDPRFTKMMIPVKSLSACIIKRLEAGDSTVESELVGARMVKWGEESFIPEAQVTHIFGRGGEVEAHIAAILFENAIDYSEASPELVSCLPSIPWEIPAEELQKRKDLRNLCVFTIDPATATDLDDALSVERSSNGVSRVGVHIADVSYFVLPDTALDIDAQIRSTSVYLLQRKLPMLPPILSENLGSLNPGVDRLAFSIFWDISPAGEVLDRWIGRTVIHSCCKLSYEHAQEMIDGIFDVRGSSCMNNWPQLHGEFEWSDIIRSVKSLFEISKILKRNRFSDGALSLESPKIVFLFDKDGIPYDCMLSERKESNFPVEEFMLLANKTAAEVITRAYPSTALLRRHPEPNMRKLREFEAFCKKHGLRLDVSSSGQLNNSLEHIRTELKNDSVLFDILMSYAARPMQMATYFCSGDLKDPETDWSHYALAVPLYTHFTSPLRRYPDIVVHRTLAATLEAEEICLKQKKVPKKQDGTDATNRCFTGIFFDKNVIESVEAKEALFAAASKYRIPHADTLADVAAHCNQRKLASRHVKDSTEKLYTWALLKNKEVLFSEARVLGLGPRFMSIYIPKLAIERRIYYDDVEGLTVEWLDATSTLVLGHSTSRRCSRRCSPGKGKSLEEVALIVSPCDVKAGLQPHGQSGEKNDRSELHLEDTQPGIPDNTEPAVFPLTMRLLSTIPVALHAIGGDEGPLDIGARLYISSYMR